MVSEAKIKRLRDNKGWSQDYMAEVLGMSQPAYSKLESGHTKLTFDKASQLAKVFEIEPEYFFSSDATYIHYGKDNSFGPVQNNTINYIDDNQRVLFEKLIHDKEQRIEDLQNQISFLKGELSSANSKLSKLINKLTDKL